MENNLKYIAIKLNGLNHYLWFETRHYFYEKDVFVGLNGWGKGGCRTNVKCNKNEINSYIYSDSLQYR